MFRRFLGSSIQKALVNRIRDQGDGGLTLDGELMDAAGLLPNDTVLCTNEHNGNQFLANVIRGRHGGGELILNGPLARQGMLGNRVTIDRYDSLSEKQMKGRNLKVLVINMSIASIKHPTPHVIDRPDPSLRPEGPERRVHP